MDSDTNDDHEHRDGHTRHHDNDHDHKVAVTADSQRRVFWVMLLTGSYMIVQVIGGILSGSLALIADAGHMLSDTAALALAWFAFHLSSRPADPRRSYGYDRFQILAALLNGLTLFAIVGWILYEAVERLRDPVTVLAGPMLAVAMVGLLVNIAGFVVLHRGDRDNVNMHGALLHVLGDLLGSVAAIVAAIVIMATGWMPIDPLLSVLVALIVLRSAWGLVRRSGHILMQGTPETVDPETVRKDLMGSLPSVVDVHHVHIWSLTNERTIATLHVRIAEGADQIETLTAVKARLSHCFALDHSTVQVDGQTCPDVSARCANVGDMVGTHVPGALAAARPHRSTANRTKLSDRRSLAHT